MKKIILIITMLLLSLSCVNLDNDLETNVPNTPNVSFVSFNYVIDDMKPGNPIALGMPDELLSQLTNKDYEMIHNTYYGSFKDKILSGDLIYKQFTLNLTEVTTGEKYQFTDKFDINNIYLIKPGTYEVTGETNSLTFRNGIANMKKCSFTINDKITVKKEDTSISLKVDYNCFLLIIENNDPPIDQYQISLHNYEYYVNPLLMDDYFYYILTLDSELLDDGQVISIVNEEFYLKDYPFENGKYYIIPGTKSEEGIVEPNP